MPGRAASGPVDHHRSAWAQTIVDETRQLWESLEGQYQTWSSGFRVFYSPVREDAKLIIVGANPGGGPESFDQADAALIPAEHEYFRFNYAMAVRMRDLFDGVGRIDLLRKSVKLNANFFRTRDTAEWQSVPAAIRDRLERHCAAQLRAVIETVGPSLILCEGMATFDQLCHLLDASRVEVPTRTAGRRIYGRAHLPSDTILAGMVHPTGARISSADRATVATELARDLANL